MIDADERALLEDTVRGAIADAAHRLSALCEAESPLAQFSALYPLPKVRIQGVCMPVRPLCRRRASR